MNSSFIIYHYHYKMVFPEKQLILFDGVCNLCNTYVQFVINRDSQNKFLFASLQSDTGQDVLKHFGLDTTEFKTLVLLQDNHIYTKSTGALRVLKQLDGLWKFSYIFIAIPSPIRDLFYNFVASNRYRFFGKKDYCMMPLPELKSRFLN
jgi:predicted DCC family thiol-disulfide oxidoreductase YuxK